MLEVVGEDQVLDHSEPCILPLVETWWFFVLDTQAEVRPEEARRNILLPQAEHD